MSGSKGVATWKHFYPRSPCGERQQTIKTRKRVRNFYPRSPCGERPAQYSFMFPPYSISIHALLAESDRWKGCRVASYHISIHALLAESDHAFRLPSVLTALFLSTLSLRRATRFCSLCSGCTLISIHALLAESDFSQFGVVFRVNGFLSTLSLRRATIHQLRHLSPRLHFYPRSPCGERLRCTWDC